MKRALLPLLLLAVAAPAFAQVKQPAAINGCQYVSAGITLQNFQTGPFTCDSTGSLRIGGTINATSAINATATLPTLTPGSQAPQGSLAGATYVQPVFSSASGGGTQVDASHGLPVNIIAGGTASASVGPTGSAVPSSADYGGMNVSGTLTGLVGTSNGLKVDGSAVTQPISASALPLPAGAATSTLQSTINTTLGSPFQAGGSIGNTAFTANAGTNLNTSALALESGGNLATIAGAVTSSVVQSNTKQVNGVTTLTGAGATGTGSQRVTTAQDSTTIAGANPGRTYNTIAASQSAQALTGGSGGATGDYLGFCVVIPTSTSPGVVTIFDNSTAVYSFPGGSSSLSNLVPFTIPVGAVSVSGAWKVTTGASLSVTCTGKFT